MAGPAGNLLAGSHARRASEGSLTGLEKRAEIAFQWDRDREGGGLSRQLACESYALQRAVKMLALGHRCAML